MNQKCVSIGILATAFFISQVPIQAGSHPIPSQEESFTSTGKDEVAPTKDQVTSNPVDEKFRKLQREMESGERSASSPKTGLANKSTSVKTPEAEPTTVLGLSFRIIMGLIFVLFLAVISIRVLKRFQSRMLSKPGKASGELFEVLETCHLGPHQKVIAVRMNDEVGVLGVTQQGISLLTMLKEPASEIRQTYARESNSAQFSDNLNKLLERFKKPKRVADLLDEAKG